MAGGRERDRRVRALAYMTAVLPHAKKPPDFYEFTGTRRPVQGQDWQAELARWQAYAAVRQ
jgi:hypothetical protein